MSNFEVTSRIQGAAKHVLAYHTSLKTELREKFQRILNRDTDSVSLEDLNDLSYYLRKIPNKYADFEAIRACRWVHELVEGSRVVVPKIVKEPHANPGYEEMMDRLKEQDERRRYNLMTRNISQKKETITFKNDIKIMQHQLSLASEIIIMTVVMFVAGYFIASRTYGDWTYSIIGGCLFGTIGLFVETWLFLIRSNKIEEYEMKQEEKEKHGDVSFSAAAHTTKQVNKQEKKNQ